MNASKLLRFTIAACFFGLLIFSFQTTSGDMLLQAPTPPPPPTKPVPTPTSVKGGEWMDDFFDSKQLSVISPSIKAYNSSLSLAVEEYLNWEQTWTEHFALGEFYQTEAISDSVQLGLIPNSNQYYTTGMYTSTVFDAQRAVDWLGDNWSNSGTYYSVTLEYRTGNNLTPDPSWSNWATPLKIIGQYYCLYGANVNRTYCNSNMVGIESSRYLQYRATFTSTNSLTTLALYAVNIYYGVYPATGGAVSIPISPIDLLSWKQVFYTSTVPAGTSIVIDVLSANDAVLLSNANTGNSIANLNPVSYPSLKLRVTLNTNDPSRTPELGAWGLKWVVNYRKYFPVIFR